METHELPNRNPTKRNVGSVETNRRETQRRPNRNERNVSSTTTYLLIIRTKKVSLWCFPSLSSPKKRYLFRCGMVGKPRLTGSLTSRQGRGANSSETLKNLRLGLWGAHGNAETWKNLHAGPGGAHRGPVRRGACVQRRKRQNVEDSAQKGGSGPVSRGPNSSAFRARRGPPFLHISAFPGRQASQPPPKHPMCRFFRTVRNRPNTKRIESKRLVPSKRNAKIRFLRPKETQRFDSLYFLLETHAANETHPS